MVEGLAKLNDTVGELVLLHKAVSREIGDGVLRAWGRICES